MNIKTMQVGPLGTNCYLLEDEHTRAAAVIDPGGDGARIEAQLRAHGAELKNAAYVLTRSSGARHQEVYRQMDLDVPAGHRAAVSLRSGDVGWDFWQEEFLRQVRAFLAEG